MAKRKNGQNERESTEPPVLQSAARIVRANINRITERSSEFVSLYVNDAQFQTTPWDVRITLGQIVGTPPTEENPTLTIKELGELRMSPQFAKRLAVVLIAQVNGYEQAIGPIPMPEE